MLKKSYFVALVYTNKKHLRSNRFHHLSFAILEGLKDEKNLIHEPKMIDSYGYYSHKIPKVGTKSLLDKALEKQGGFRIAGSYAELKQEKLTDLDLGFGLSADNIVEIKEEEKERLLKEEIPTILQTQKNFFAEADNEALKITEQANITDPKQKTAFYEDKLIELREKHYEQKLETDEKVPDFLIEETARASGLISEKRFKQEKLRERAGIEFFEFDLNPQSRTCKTMGFDLIIDSLNHDESGIKRKMYLSKLKNDYFYTQSIPIFSGGNSSIIFQSKQDKYTATTENVPTPDRNFNNKNISCQLLAYNKNTYIDLDGKEQTLRHIDKQKEYTSLLENLIHLKRLLNDFCSGPRIDLYQQYLTTLDKAIGDCYNQANNIHNVIKTYHKVLLKLKYDGCFDSISQDILQTNQPINAIKDLTKHVKQKHIRMEDGVYVELNRLKKLKEHADSIKLNYDILFPSLQSRFFSFCHSFFAKKPTTNYEMEDVNKNAALKI